MSDATRLIKDIIGGKKIVNKNFESSIILDFDNVTFQTNTISHISFENCKFTKLFRIQNAKGYVSITLRNCSFVGGQPQIINNVDVNDIVLEDCQFDTFLILNSTTDYTRIFNCISKTIISLADHKSETVDIVWDTPNKNKASFSISSPEIEELNIESQNNINKLSVFNLKVAEIKGSIGSLNIIPESVKSILIEPLFVNEKNEVITYNEIGSIVCSNQSFSGMITFNDLQIKELVFDNVENSNGFVRFNELKIENANFFDVTIKSFYWNQVWFKKKLIIERCDLSGLKIANTRWLEGKKMSNSFIDKKVSWFYLIRKKWFDRFESNEDNIKNFYSIREFCFGRLNSYDEDDLRVLQYERETYRQLKAASIANHNQVEALEFLKNEMRLFWKEIRINGGINWGDRILVFVNRIISDFGQNWWLPLVWLIAIHFMLLFALFSGNWVIWLNSHHKVTFLGEFISTLNPVHQTPQYVVTDSGKVTDFALRIFSSYFIYHFIIASRKYGKSS